LAEPLIENVSVKPLAGAAFSTFVHLKRRASALIKIPPVKKVPETATSRKKRRADAQRSRSLSHFSAYQRIAGWQKKKVERSVP
jgi:hypothetical protein